MPTKFGPPQPRKKLNNPSGRPKAKPLTGDAALRALNTALTNKLIEQGYKPGTKEFNAARVRQNQKLIGGTYGQARVNPSSTNKSTKLLAGKKPKLTSKPMATKKKGSKGK